MYNRCIMINKQNTVQLFLRHRTADEERVSTDQRPQGPTRENSNGPTISGSLEPTPQPDVIPYSSVPCPLCFPVVADRHGILNPREFTHSASGDFIAVHSDARFMWRYVDIYIYIHVYTRRIKCKRFARDWPWEVPSFIRETYPPGSSLENLYGSAIDLS